ncbi:maturation of Asn-linked oligosaccharides protein [Coccidioides posadasii str. Silveira]|uniref:Mannosyl-oligosaccharide alpha-1,2-mannosidase n=2 Tax=Coccidioides posadasii TaxID=199306 RepID=MNS1B_COCPS|nr:RecName: Full=Mannosyl-oligosaccharide alpha-1,2-mannosidase; AltName: Full=Class I alpha-mannosidase; AltName: Full=Man(9)-alpha-mannosidase; Flags: Precursor [Coccidioides posadasii str. Silveira]ABB36773.3 1,2-alpha-D-mannosidase [Coccidioides posadasii str. Silveira]EFW20805.1 alpha-mannosidase [Coccidioides posadasii str. Silveira]KMM72636.1 alpha-mannosidase 1 [Coccidioides posadasii RMSCC 3488]QVM08188.1 maturation of Asn-linked oligosaccharides protein [Coccidioides posadasii str. Si
MKGSPVLAVCAAALTLIPSVVALPMIDKDLPSSISQSSDKTSQERAEAVKAAFRFAWEGYLEHAFPNDELHPVSNTPGNSRNGWGASAVDALSTAIIMDMPDVVEKILDHISNIDYSQTDTMCSLFETTIRYLGGMISAYDLLKGPGSHLVSDPAKVDVLLAQSLKLADVLKFAFDTKTGIPANELNITDKSTDGSTTNGLATTGTLVLEWTRLSDITGDPEYGRLAQKGESYLLNPQPSSSEPFPGLVGRTIDIETGLFRDDYVSWGGGSDSFYEYLIKMYVYDKGRFGKYKDRWVTAAESTIEHLKSSPSTRKDLTFVATYSGGRLGLNSGHLTCFDGGNFLLGGQILNRDDFTKFGLELVEGCYATYAATATKIGPEGFGWDATKVPEAQAEFYKEAGFYITTSYYNLRPEVIESIYYAYRMTKDPKYQEWAWDAFVAINATTRTSTGFTAIGDVNTPDGGRKYDNQESFLFAEVMKYSYLIHSPEADWQVAGPGGTNAYVFNTEAHPVKVFSRGC